MRRLILIIGAIGLALAAIATTGLLLVEPAVAAVDASMAASSPDSPAASAPSSSPSSAYPMPYAASQALPTGLLAPTALARDVVAQGASAPAVPALPASSPAVPLGNAPAAERGRYLAAAGDCAACHTRPGGAPYAGGRPIETPFGTVLSANLTPDATGLQRWTADQFYRAMHEGLDDEGRHLYPAFPYNYYTKMPRADTDAIFAWLKTLPPVANPLRRNRLPFPFNIRAFVGVWNMLYLDTGNFVQDSMKSAQWNRGAYLVQGPGHCGACHTPKTVLGGPRNGRELQGGSFGTWFAPDITPGRRTGLGAWSRDEVVAFLRTGRNAHASAAGEMGLVVADSTSKLSDGDLQAIALYLADRPVAAPASASSLPPAQMTQGAAIFVDECAACHRDNARGEPGAFPPLAGSANAQQRDPTTLLHFILAGVEATPTDFAPTPFTMPAFAWKLDDAQVAAVATFVRNSWGNAAAAVSTSDVETLRGKLKFDRAFDRRSPATPMTRPGPGTLSAPDTDSRDNGTPAAGRIRPATSASTAGPASGPAAGSRGG